MSKLDVKQAIAVGYSLVVIFSVADAARSDTPIPVFVETMLVGLAEVSLAVAVVVAIKRLRANTFGAKAMPRLDVRRAVAVGFIVGVLVEAALSFRDSAPISTFLSNVAFVLWVTLFVALGLVGFEVHRSRRTRAS